MKRIRKLLTGFVAVAVLMRLFNPLPALAASQCAPIKPMVEQLSKKFHEDQLFVGHLGGGESVVIAANPNGSTWTALTVSRDGKACIVAAGGQWSVGEKTPIGTEG